MLNDIHDDQRKAQEYAKQQQVKLDARKLRMEVKRLFQETAGYSFYDPRKNTIDSLALKYELPREIIIQYLN